MWLEYDTIQMHRIRILCSLVTTHLKRKFEKTGVVKELRRRQQFNKPSEVKRLKMERAVYVQSLRQNEE